MFLPQHIIYEDNHLLVVNKLSGDLVQPSPDDDRALENEIKEYIKVRDNKPGAVFLGVVHRIDRPVSGVVLFAKTSKALVRMNEQIRDRKVDKRYWAIVEQPPHEEAAELVHHISRNAKSNKSHAALRPSAVSKEARLRYEVLARSDRYTLVEVELMTGRHHQIRAQLAAIGSPIKGDLKYGARRSNPDGGISLHSRRMSFVHPVTKELMCVEAPVPSDDALWRYFEAAAK